nr:TFIIB-type zinc ribbon-containing protein [Halomarina sp. PSR21]
MHSTRQTDRTDETDETEQQRTVTDGVETCPECGGSLVREGERGELACSECGLVVEEEGIDLGPEWRAYDSAERDRKSRVGAPITTMMHDRGLSTSIDWQDRDAYGNSLSSRQRAKMQRLRTWNERFRTRDSKERNLKQALGEIDRMASALGLPENVRETASVIYRRALNEGLLLGRSIEGMGTAALYAASRLGQVPRSTSEFASVSRVEKLEFERTYRYLARELELGVPPANPSDYLPRVASDLDASSATERTARRILDAGTREGVHVGKSPIGLAAAAIYAAGLLTDAELTQSDVTAVTDVSAVTIRNRYRELLTAARERGVA